MEIKLFRFVPHIYPTAGKEHFEIAENTRHTQLHLDRDNKNMTFLLLKLQILKLINK